MSRIGVSITKAVAFRGATQEFSNVYYYEVTGVPSVSEADTLIDNITQIEKGIHSTGVSFIRGRCWTAGGTQSQNNMISQKNLTGTGSRTHDGTMDRERAFLVRLRAGSDSRGNPVYLRKWFHSCGLFYSGQAITSGQMANTSPLSSGDKTAIGAGADAFKSVAFGANVAILVSKAGRQFDVGATFQSHNYLEHHQLGDQWRAQ